MQYGSHKNKDVVLIHGLASSHAIWKPLVALLRSTWHITAPDLLGFGNSPTPTWAQYDVAQHARHVIAGITTKKVRTPVVLVGHSMGCLIAVHIATIRPDLVSRLVLYELPLFADVPDFRAHSRMRRRYFALFQYIADRSEIVFRNPRLRQGLGSLRGVNLQHQTWLPFRRSIKNTIMEQQAYDELHALSIATDIIQGRLDIIAPRTDVKRMLAANRHIRIHVVNRSHGISKRAAEEIAKVLNTPPAGSR